MDALPSESKSEAPMTATSMQLDPLQYTDHLVKGPSVQSRNLSTGKTETWMVDNYDVEQAMREFSAKLADESKQSVKVVGKRDKAEYDRMTKFKFQERFKEHLMQTGRVKAGFVKWISEDGGVEMDGMYGSGTAETGWLPPNTITVDEQRKRQILLEAKAPVCCVKGPPPNPQCCGRDASEKGLLNKMLCIKCRPFHSSPDTHISAGGLGIMLYFRLQKHLLSAFAIASLVLLPGIFFTSQGQRIRDDQMDLLQLSAYSVANIGNQPDSALVTYNFLSSVQQNFSWSLAAVKLREASSQRALLGAASTSYEVPGIGQVDAGEALAAVGFLDSIAIVAFFAIVAAYFNMVKLKANVPGAHRKVLLQDYSVKVTGIPADITAEEVREHFSGLYALDSPDWRLDHWWKHIWGARPQLDHDPYVSGSKRTQDTLAPDGWGVVQETRNGRNLNLPVRNVEHLAERFEQNEATNFVGGWVADVQLIAALGEMHLRYSGFADLEAKFLQSKALMMKFHPTSQYHNEVKFKKAKSTVNKWQGKLSAARLDILAAHQTDTAAVFVVFNNNESKLRCLEDFGGSAGYFWWALQPNVLRLQRRQGDASVRVRMVVEEATDPTDILWENVEFRHDERNTRSAIVCLCTLLVLMISVVCLSFGEGLEDQMDGIVPEQELCQLQIPSAATGTYNTLNLGLNLNRSPELETNQCNPGEYYISVLSDGQPKNTRGAPDICFGNCVNPDDPRICVLGAGIKTDQVSQQASYVNQVLIPEYNAKTLVACTCMDMLRRSASVGLVSGPQELLTTHGTMCGELVTLYLQSRGMVVFAGIALVAVNSILERLMTGLNAFQKHQSRSDARFSLLIKIFLAQFVNTALVVVLVNSTLPFFGGDFSDFTLEWHVQVGAQMMTTLFMNMLGSHAITVLNCLVVQPIRRYFLLAKEKHSQLTPQGLLRQVAPPPFHLESKYASMLSNVGVILLFSAAYPILYVLGLFTMLISFYAEKLLMLKFYKKPQDSDPRQAEFAVKCMRIILFMHAAVGFWVLGASGVVQHQWFGPNHVWQTAGDQSTIDSTGQQQQQQNSGDGNENYQTPSDAAKAQRDSAVAVGQLASALKEWEVQPAWDGLGLVPRIASIAGTGLGIITLSFLVTLCWGSPCCMHARYGWQVFEAQDYCACQREEEDSPENEKKSASTVISVYETTDGQKLEVKATKEQQEAVFRETSQLIPPFTQSFYRMLPPVHKTLPKPSLPTIVCLKIDFKLPCALVCFTQREIRQARRWARHQLVLARKSSNRFANKLKDSSSDGENVSIEATVKPTAALSPSPAEAAGRSRQAHFNLGEVQGLPLWRPQKGHKISKGQKAAGWLLIKDKPRHQFAVQRVREWNDAKRLAQAQSKGLARHSARPGTQYTSWELIATYGLHTYDIHANPHYAGFVKLLIEAEQIRARQAGGSSTDLVFEPRMTRLDRVKRTLYESTMAYLEALKAYMSGLIAAVRRWYISARGGDPNAAEQAGAVDEDSEDDASHPPGIMAQLSKKLKSAAPKDEAAIPPNENYEMYLARRNTKQPQVQRLIQKGFRRVSKNQASAKVAPALTLGVLAESSAVTPRGTDLPTETASAVPDPSEHLLAWAGPADWESLV